MYFLLFLFPFFFRSEWEEKRIISLFFLLPFLFWERSRRLRKREKTEKSLPFPPLFSFFLFLFFRFSDFFFLLFVPLSFFGGEMGVGERRNFSSSFSKFLSFLGEKWEDQLEKMKEVLPIFLLNFLYFFLSFDPSSFQFLGKEMGKWEDKNVCPNHAKKILQEQLCLSKTKMFSFG